MPQSIAENAASVGFVGLLIGLVTLIVRQVGPWRKQITDMEQRLREELRGQLETERVHHEAERRQAALEADELRDSIASLEQRLSSERKKYEAEVSLYRHQVRNLTQCFDAMLMLLKADTEPQKAITMVEDMRSRQMVAEAEETAIIRSAEIQSEGAAE